MCCVAELDEQYIERMEDVLALYRNAYLFTQKQIDSARGDKDTKLSAGLQKPED